MERLAHAPSATPRRQPRPPLPAALRYADRNAPDGPASPAWPLAGSDALWLRAIAPGDHQALERLFHRLSPVEIRRRFLHAMRELPPGMAQQLSTPDGLREQAWVIASAPRPGAGELHGVGRMYLDLPTACAEFALLVERAHAGHGHGRQLLAMLMHSARDAGMHELWSHVAHDNLPMLQLARSEGGNWERVPGDAGVIRVHIPL